MSGITFTLSEPITAHGKEVETLELTKPTTKDVRELGYPFSPGGGGGADMKLHPDVGARWISRLAKIPMSSVDQIEPADFLELHAELCSFFTKGETATTSSTSVSSTAPGSGASTPT